MTGNSPASILARLLTLAKQRGDDYSLLLNRFALERLLLRKCAQLSQKHENYEAHYKAERNV